MTAAKIEVQRPAVGSVVVVVDGEIDLSNAPDLDAVVGSEVATSNVVLDLSGITFMDSSAIAVIVKAQNSARQRGGSLVIRNPSSRARQLLEVVALDFLIEPD